jgi:ribosomal protein S12 methylthiotransferase
LKAGLIALGCAKNLVDSEIMLGSLLKEGVEITNDPASADVLIVNTCSFIDSAQEESVDTILESSEVRDTRRPEQALIVAGCLPQRFREDLPNLMPEVDAFMGIDQVTSVKEILDAAIERRAAKVQSGAARTARTKVKRLDVQKELERLDVSHKQPAEGPNLRATDRFGKTRAIIGISKAPVPAGPLIEVNARPRFIQDFSTPRFRLTPKHFAYVKIAEGCNHPCSFCIIPRMRGSHRSRRQADIVTEAKTLLAEGVRELNLISQDSTYYGMDLRPSHSRAIAGPEQFGAAFKALPQSSENICALIRELNGLPGDFWIRLLYTHPAHWTDELIQTIRECPKVARYVDIPLQHIHDNMLERMRRETSGQFISDLLARIRAGIPGIALRTTFIVGFPGETETAFERLLEFIRETKFERLGVFAYSQEEGTRAGAMAGQISDKVKQRRRELAMKTQHTVAVRVAEGFMGRTLKALVEKPADARELGGARIASWEHGFTRGQEEHPRTPGKYLVARGEADAPDIDGRVYIRGRLPLGGFARVKVIGHTDYDLIAEPAG